MPRLLVLGLTGFAGKHLATFLSSQHHTGISLVGGQYRCDLRDMDSIRSLISEANPDWILNLAAQASAAEALKNPLATYDINIMGVARLLETLKSLRYSGRLLFVSSSEVYGALTQAQLPVRETEIPYPRNPYAASKLAGEALCHEGVASGLNIVIARPFNHIGPGQDRRFAVGSFAREVASFKMGARPAVLRVGDLSVARDFTDVRDIVRGYILLLQKGQHGKTYNLASGKAVTLGKVVDMLRDLSGIPFDVEVDAARLRAVDTPVTLGDASEANALGWTPVIGLRTTLGDMLDHLIVEQRKSNIDA